ncbi:MAG TPA: lipid II flippase MurJ [Candidatus Limnocylindrales bacterium]|nr:lipid II flippase MurJ [Candidatus Limnocylindrales bacterium]
MTTADERPVATPAAGAGDELGDDPWTRWLPGPLRGLVDRFLPRGAIVLSILTLGYFAMRQIQNRVLANAFGLGTELDVYYVAIRIPEVALDVLVAAGLTAPFVPIFSQLRKADERDANDFARTALTAAVLVMIAAAAGLVLLAPAIADLVAGSLDASARALYVDLFRINCLTLALFAASIAIGEVLVANRRFFFYALAPVVYPAGAIVATLLFADQIGVYAPAWGTVAGTAAHLAVRTIGSTRTTFRIRPMLAVRTAAFREFVRLMLPRMLSYPIDPILLSYFAVLALSFGTGSASALTFADDYRVVPVILIAQQFSLAVFPALSAAHAEGDGRAFRSILSRNVITIGVLTTIAAILMAVLAPMLIGILLRGGAFDAEDVQQTAAILAAFAVSVPLDGLTYPLARALYATHNTVLQVIANIGGFVTIIVVSQATAASLGILCIPVSYAVGAGVKAGLLAVFLARRLRVVERDRAARASAAGGERQRRGPER